MSFTFPPPRTWRASRHCKIAASACYLPPRVRTNAEILAQQKLPFQETVIQRTIGVRTRHVASQEQCDSDLLAEASRACLAKAGIGVAELSKIIVNKLLGDRILPPTASLLQRKLGSSVAMQCMDLDGGSNSFLQAVDLSAKCIHSGDDHILIASGGKMHSLLSETDPRIAFLYGDGASAFLLAPSEQPHFLASYFFSNPAFAHLAGGIHFHDIAQALASQENVEMKLRNLFTLGNWKDAQEFILEAAQVTVQNLLQSAGISLAQIDRFLVSEWNYPLWELLIKHIGIPVEKTRSVLGQWGNTMSANLPMQFFHAEQQNPLQPGQHTLFLSIGEGISGGGMIYRT